MDVVWIMKVQYKVVITEDQFASLSFRSERVARIGLSSVLSLTADKDDLELARLTAAILQHMFKHSEETCAILVEKGGLDAIVYWCRLSDIDILRDCAMALANCAMYGGKDTQKQMVCKRAPDWLFPLAFNKDTNIRFYACLAITLLANNKEIEKQVKASGTLDLVEPFIASLDLTEFTLGQLDSMDNAHGRAPDYLQQLLPLLDASRVEAQCVAAFYFSVEAGIKAHRHQAELFHDIGIVQSLKRLASYSASGTVRGLARHTLRILKEEEPLRLSANVPCWKNVQVQAWVNQVGFANLADRFRVSILSLLFLKWSECIFFFKIHCLHI
uniref:Sterile alpha and TIR motif-containing protein 1 n=1 Tax=Eptatretus burgeri TaxID=7764 RepID=A0A8C4QA82_EPTBU